MKRILLVVVVLIGSSMASQANAQSSSVAEIAARLGISKDAIARVEKGEVVSEELEASSDKDLAIAIAMQVAAPTKEVFELVDGRTLSKHSAIILSEGEIDPGNPSLAAMKLPADVLKQLADDPDDTFFLAKAEAKQLADAAKQGPEQVHEAFRAVLAARVTAYWEKGVAGVEGYAGGKGRDPKADLKAAQGIAKKLVKNPTFLKEIQGAPSKSPGKATHHFSWAIEKGRDQAAPVLIHRVLYREGDAEVFLERRFYSGYDYDALQILVGVLPAHGDQSVVFYTNHTYTAQVAGFGGSAKRSIGRKLLQKKIVAELEGAQKAIAAR